ncbi:MAG: hypothetical protein ACR2MD_01070 [Aridibacter sp.]
MAVKHKFTNPQVDGTDDTIVRPSDWNDEHFIETLAETPDANTRLLIHSQTVGAVNGLDIAHSTAQSVADFIIAQLTTLAPATLDTFKELADALGNDPNFAASTAALIASKVSKTGDETVAGVKTFTSSPIVPDPIDNTDTVNKQYAQSLIAAISNTGGSESNITALISGGQTILEAGYTYRVSAAAYFIQGLRYDSTEQTVTLDTADAAFDRFDVLALNTIGSLVKITGIPSANPTEPDIDPTTQIKLTLILVQAGTTAPPAAANEDIYKENTEWTSSTSGTGWNANSTLNPNQGTKTIEAASTGNGSYVQLTRSTAETLETFNTLILFVRSKAAFGNNKVLRVQFYDNGIAKGSPVTLASGYYGFDSSITTGYQLVAIPLSRFVMAAGTSVNALRVTSSGAGLGLYIDDVSLQNSGSVIVSNSSGLTQDQADALYLSQTFLQRKGLNLTTSSIADSAETSGTIALGKSFDLLRVAANKYCRITLYKTAAARSIDAARIFGSRTYIGTSHGIILDLKLTAATGLSWLCSPDVNGSNGDIPAATNIYYRVQNLSGSASAVSIDFIRVENEV